MTAETSFKAGNSFKDIDSILNMSLLQQKTLTSLKMYVLKSLFKVFWEFEPIFTTINFKKRIVKQCCPF